MQVPWSDLRTVVLLLALFVAAYALRRLGILPTSPTEAAAIKRADRAEAELASNLAEISRLTAENLALERTRSLEAVLELLGQVIDKLAHFNGSLAHVEEGLRQATEGLKLVTGLIVGAAEFPIRKDGT